MRRLLYRAALAISFVLAAGAAAQAQHFTGQYQGTGQVEGTFLSLQESGTAVLGRLTGASAGTLQARSTGDTFEGVVNIQDRGQFQVFGHWTPQGIALDVRDASSEGTALFVPAENGPGGGGGLGKPSGEGQQAASNGPFYTYRDGDRRGPLPLDEVNQLIAAGTITRDTLMWYPGQPEWVHAGEVRQFASVLPPDHTKYYIVENGKRVGPMSLGDLTGRISAGTTAAGDLVWKSGMPDWAPAGTFAELGRSFLKETPPPPPNKVAGQAIGSNAPPDVPGQGSQSAENGGRPQQPTNNGGQEQSNSAAAAAAPAGAAGQSPGGGSEAGASQAAGGQGGGEQPPSAITPGPEGVGGPGSSGQTPVGEAAAGQASGGPVSGGEATPGQSGPDDGTEALMATLRAQFATDLEKLPADAQSGATACFAAVVAKIAPADRLILADRSHRPPDDVIDRLQKTYPSFQDDLTACLPASGPTPATGHSLSLPDGRNIILVGGTDQSIFPNDGGGYSMTVDGIKIDVVGSIVTVNGVDRPPVDFTRNLQITVKDGEVAVTPDVAQ